MAVKTIKENKYTLIPGTFCQCTFATVDFDPEQPGVVYCSKYGKLVTGWTVSQYCRGSGGCDE